MDVKHEENSIFQDKTQIKNNEIYLCFHELCSLLLNDQDNLYNTGHTHYNNNLKKKKILLPFMQIIC